MRDGCYGRRPAKRVYCARDDKRARLVDDSTRALLFKILDESAEFVKKLVGILAIAVSLQMHVRASFETQCAEAKQHAQRTQELLQKLTALV